MSNFIRYETDGAVGIVTIDRPEKRNAMTFAMLGEFLERVAQAGADSSTRALIIAGAPGAFCAGTDLADLASIPGAQRGLRGRAEDRGRWWPIVECPKPVVCAIDGPAVGMGAEFTSQCDIRIATPKARFAWNFVHRGLVPDTGAGSWLLPRLIGTQRALKLLYTGDFLAADEALAIGYVDQVVPSEALHGTALTLARKIAEGSPFSQRRIKSMVYEGLGGDVAEHMQRHTQALAECFKSDDHKEGVASFLERRPARFTGS
jgi:enoyl-CoA hydratase/carnithine racemase